MGWGRSGLGIDRFGGVDLGGRGMRAPTTAAKSLPRSTNPDNPIHHTNHPHPIPPPKSAESLPPPASTQLGNTASKAARTDLSPTTIVICDPGLGRLVLSHKKLIPSAATTFLRIAPTIPSIQLPKNHQLPDRPRVFRSHIAISLF
jgi:hypothetical protein